MRVMEILPFPQKFENPDLADFLTVRLGQTTVLWPKQAIALVGYMGWPNDVEARDEAVCPPRGSCSCQSKL
jgi:hypothetical protein